MKKIIIKHKKYTISEIFNICNGEYSITLHKDVVNKIQSSRKFEGGEGESEPGPG